MMEGSEYLKIEKLPHHEQQELCTSRPLYRQGKRLTAVKVYSVVSESSHLLVSGVPALGLRDELRSTAAKFGDILSINFVSGYTEEPFVDVFHLQYARIQSARYAKKQLDGLSFFGGILHVCYAPELESIAETRVKLNQRKREVANRLWRNATGQNNPKRDRSRALQGTNHQHQQHKDNVNFTNCIWNGVPQSSDPRLQSSTELAKVYGPNLPSDCIQQMYSTPSSSHDSVYSSKQTSQSLKFVPRQVHAGTCTGTSDISTASTMKYGTDECTTASSTACENTFETSPVKKRKLKNSDSSGKCINSTILAVREKVRSICVPNLPVIIFKKQEEKESD